MADGSNARRFKMIEVTPDRVLRKINELDVDRLAILGQQITKLKIESDLIKDSLKDYCSSNNVQKVYGIIHSVTYVEANRKTIDYKTLCSDLNLDDEILGKYTTHNAVYTIKVS